MKMAWLIELKDHTEGYWYWHGRLLNFPNEDRRLIATKKPEDAVQFCRYEDAEMVRLMVLDDLQGEWYSAGHSWALEEE